MLHHPKHLLALLALAIAIMALGPRARSTSLELRQASSMAASGDLAQRNSNAFAMILGEFRASAADLMFMKTERYLDNGVAYEPHIDLDTMRQEDAGEHDHAPEHEHEHEHEDGEHHHPATIIRTAEGDFRSFLGELERTVKPYRDPRLPHNHTSGEELLPWYRLVTLANPRQVRPYLIASMWLSQQGQLDQAIAFLHEGIRNNPSNPELFRLYEGLATAYVKMRHEGHEGELWARKALEAASEAFALGLARREAAIGGGPMEEPADGWNESFEEDLLMAGHYVALLNEYLGERQAALEAASSLQAIAPDFAPNNEWIRRLEP